ncbi:GDSL-type esterase/lipase family protein [Rossellomorea marisflavi]|uniref:GDSL-type esterase/lipase family protein n=1 Tax=Rossellomorea marisflavi TaxID=189381 RepID=UPI003458AE8E
MKVWKMVGVLVVVVLLAGAYYLFFTDKKEAADKKYVVALGDSLVYGKGDKENSGYIGRLEDKVNKEKTDETYSFENLGIPGQKSNQLQKQLMKPDVTKDLPDADLFIINIGTNDLIKSNGGDFKPLHDDKIVEAKEEYLDNLDEIIDTLHTLNEDAPILVIGLYNPYPDRESDKIEAYVDDWNETIIKEVKKQENVKYVSSNPLFKGKSKGEYFSDSLHPNGKGYDLIADQIMDSYNF